MKRIMKQTVLPHLENLQTLIVPDYKPILEDHQARLAAAKDLFMAAFACSENISLKYVKLESHTYRCLYPYSATVSRYGSQAILPASGDSQQTYDIEVIEVTEEETCDIWTQSF